MRMAALAVILLLLPAAHALKINEIMPNPTGYDNASKPQGEWIEIYNDENQEINIEGFYLYDANDYYLPITEENTEPTTRIRPSQYVVVYRNQNKYFTLNNNGDEVKLYDGHLASNPNEMDMLVYETSYEASSIARIPDASKSIQICAPTPGQENSCNESEPEIEETQECPEVICPVCSCPTCEPEIIIRENKTCPELNEKIVFQSTKKQNLNTAKNLFITFLVFIVVLLLKPKK